MRAHRTFSVNPLNAELNPICHLLALGAHHILHVGRIRVNVNFWLQNKMTVIPHPLYASDMVLCDFFIFPKLRMTFQQNFRIHLPNFKQCMSECL